MAWLKKTLRLPQAANLERSLAAREPDTHGLTVLPFLAGERSPNWAAYARGTLQGLSLATSSLDLLQATMEAVAFRVRLIFELLRPWLQRDCQVVASRGALFGSPAWLRIMTDALGQPLVVSQVRGASARGTALLALEALGVLRDLSEAPPFLGTTLEPHPERHARYLKALKRQQNLYEKLLGPSSPKRHPP